MAVSVKEPSIGACSGCRRSHGRETVPPVPARGRQRSRIVLVNLAAFIPRCGFFHLILVLGSCPVAAFVSTPSDFSALSSAPSALLLGWWAEMQPPKHPPWEQGVSGWEGGQVRSPGQGGQPQTAAGVEKLISRCPHLYKIV